MALDQISPGQECRVRDLDLDGAELQRILDMEFQVPVPLCLSMMDVAESRGFEIDRDILATELGTVIGFQGNRGNASVIRS
jgi:Fe2+ transport system protein B